MQDRQTKNTWIRSTFDKANHKLVDEKYNSRLLALLDLENISPCFRQIDSVTALLKKVAMCRYQAKLLRKYCTEPQRYLTLDCDNITLTVRCSKRDIDSLLKPVGAKQKVRFLKAGTAAKPADFRVLTASTYDLNGGGNRNYGKPYYSHGFRLQFNDDIYKSVFLYLETKARKVDKYSLRLKFNPNKLTKDEIKQALSHIQDRIGGKYRYKQLFGKAKVTRIDFGVLLPGISSVFAHVFRDNAKAIHSDCIPFDRQRVVETTYLGCKKTASHCIVYEKLLKESKSYPGIRKLLEQLAVTTRIEFRHLSNREGYKSNLVDLAEFPSRLKQVRFISPKYFYLLNEETLITMSTDKRQQTVREIQKQIRRQLKKHGKSTKVYKIDLDWLEKEQKLLASSLIDLIKEPKN
ncbi:hypothetical protein [Alteromonas sp. H39]|uniref:hypothetical protein n=1 Tax=Alteromonas sp. H39 TaxID=3389876 RepID=UPI0039DF366D